MTEIEKLGFVTDNYNIVEDNDENPEDDEDGDIDLTTVLDMAFEELGLAEKRQIYSCFSNGIGVLEINRTTNIKKQIKQ